MNYEEIKERYEKLEVKLFPNTRNGWPIAKSLRLYYNNEIEKKNRDINEQGKSNSDLIIKKIKKSLLHVNMNNPFVEICAANKSQYFIKSDLLFPNEVEEIDEELKKKIYELQKKAQEGTLELTEENLQKYVDGFLILVSGDKDVKTPPIKEIFDIDTFKRYGDLPDRYIIDSTPYIDKNFSDEFKNDMSDDEKLNYFVQKARHYLMERKFILEIDSLEGICEAVSAKVSKDCMEKGLKDTIIFDTEHGHYATLIKINGKDYLIDCTYRQFFTEMAKNAKARYIYDKR